MKIFSIILAAFAASTGLHANELREVEVVSYGLTREEAVYNGLVEATARVNGVDVASTARSSFSSEDGSSSWFGLSLESSSASSAVKKDISSVTQGYVKEYSVLELVKEAGEWKATLMVSVPVYQPLGIDANSRRKIAVMPFSVSAAPPPSGAGADLPQQLVEQISQALVNQITQTRKFTVLDRSNGAQIAQERDLILSEHARVDERIKLGQLLGVDYLLVGTLNHAQLTDTKQRSTLTGELMGGESVELIIDYRVIAIATRQVKWAETIKMLVPQGSTESSLPMALQNAVEKVTGEITNQLLAAIYPTRILKITDAEEVILNQGGNSLSLGLRMDVMKLGEAVIDPYTKESLGASETKIAEVQVTRITPKMSYAKLVSGSLDELEAYQICRRQPGADHSVERGSWRESKVQVKETGGVVLPFD